mmetsp:Transcript_24259/g.57454  ORF Transcript_24259/g.57454 Transcript_24259/m.57454 type:complete len:436 (-) Transcript_24259:1688-2995(-)
MRDGQHFFSVSHHHDHHLRPESSRMIFTCDVCSFFHQNLCSSPVKFLDILCEALELTGLVDDFDTDLWTLFAPTDDAFRQLAPGQVSGLANDLNALTQLMLFHAAPGVSLNTTELVCDDRLEMANGDDSFTTCFTGEDGAIAKGQAGDDNLEVDIAVIPRIMSSIDSCNGQINVIDSLMLFGGFSIMMDTVQDQTPEPSSTTTLLPSDMPSLVLSTNPSVFPSDIPSMVPSTSPSDLPSDIPSMIPSRQPTDETSLPLPSTSDGSGEYDPCTITGVACSLEDFSTLCAALKATGLDKSLDTVTEEPVTIFTVFAPTNAAFQELGAATLKFLLEINTDLLAEILLFHVVADRALLIDDLECSGLVVCQYLHHTTVLIKITSRLSVIMSNQLVDRFLSYFEIYRKWPMEPTAAPYAVEIIFIRKVVETILHRSHRRL